MQTAELILQHIVRPPKTGIDKPPLLILLHGQRGSETDFFEPASKFDDRLFIASLRAPFSISAKSHVWFHSEPARGDLLISPAHIEYSRQRISKFIQKAPALFDTDPTQVYLMGFDQGAIMSLGMMLSEPQSLAGVISLSGLVVPEVKAVLTQPERLKNFPVMVTQGTFDEVYTPAQGRATRDFLLSLVVMLNYREYPIGHHLTQESLADARIWLSKRLDLALPPAPAKPQAATAPAPASASSTAESVTVAGATAHAIPRKTTASPAPLPYTVRLSRVHLKVRDLERAITFYSRFLGLRLVERVGNVFAFMTSSSQHHEVALQRVGADAPRPHPDSTGLHAAGFEVPDQVSFARAYRLLTEAGIKVKATDQIIGWVMQFNDPDGNGIEIHWDTRNLPGKADFWQGRELPLEPDRILEILRGTQKS